LAKVVIVLPVSRFPLIFRADLDGKLVQKRSDSTSRTEPPFGQADGQKNRFSACIFFGSADVSANLWLLIWRHL
jgi:hypothetical protein